MPSLKKKSKSKSKSKSKTMKISKGRQRCPRKYTSKYVSRRSPPYSANHVRCRGTKKMGNDGKMYLSKKTSKNSFTFRWVKQVK